MQRDGVTEQHGGQTWFFGSCPHSASIAFTQTHLFGSVSPNKLHVKEAGLGEWQPGIYSWCLVVASPWPQASSSARLRGLPSWTGTREPWRVCEVGRSCGAPTHVFLPLPLAPLKAQCSSVPHFQERYTHGGVEQEGIGHKGPGNHSKRNH